MDGGRHDGGVRSEEGGPRLVVGRSDGQRLLHVLLPVDGMGSQMERQGGDGKRCERFGRLPPAS